jgi:hypothetical protein
MTLAAALLFPPSLFDQGSPAPTGGRLLWEDAAFILLEDGSGYLTLE